MAFEHIGALWSLLIQFNPFAANLVFCARLGWWFERAWGVFA